MSSPFEFPSPIGGVPFDSDFGPSILFAALYAVVCLLGFWRVAYKSTRTLLVITTLIFTIGILEAMRAASDILGIQWFLGIPMNRELHFT